MIELIPTSEKSCAKWENRNSDTKHEEGMIMSKPKLVVTFLANSKSINKMDGFGSGVESPFFMDPLQRLLQFFFSSFIRDFTPALPKEETIDIKTEKNEVDNSSDFDWLNKNDESTMFCEHGMNGFCRSCHMKAKNMLDTGPGQIKRHINISSLLHVEKSKYDPKLKRNITTKELMSSTTTKQPIKTQKTDAGKHKRHYFLSISGDTDQSVTAPETSVNKRLKRNSTNNNFFKIFEDTIYESLNKNPEILRKENPAPSSTITTGDVDDSENILIEDNDQELFKFGITPHHEAEYSHGLAYFFLVTLPVVCTFAVVILFLCIFLRTRSWCCKLFLKEPGKTLEERNATKKSKHIAADRKSVV